MTEASTENLAGDVAQVEQDVQDEAPVVETTVAQDAAAVEKTVSVGMSLGHRAEDLVQLLEELWRHGVAVVMHSKPVADVTPSPAPIESTSA